MGIAALIFVVAYACVLVLLALVGRSGLEMAAGIQLGGFPLQILFGGIAGSSVKELRN